MLDCSKFMKFDFNDKRIPELFLGLIFVVLLVIAILLVLYLPEGSFSSSNNKQAVQTTSNVVLNSYNSNSFNEKSSDFGRRDFDYYKKHGNHWEDESEEKERKYLKYSSYGEHSKEERYFSNYRDTFRVHVVNKDYEGGYFKVRFEFCDYYDDCISRSIQKYIPAKEERTFVYSDIQIEEFKYHDWSYEVFPDEVDR